MNVEASDLIRHALKEAPPAFHFWDGQPQTGGFSMPHFEFIDKQMDAYVARLASANSQDLTVVETGAGLSTLLFLARGHKVVSFSLSDVLDKIAAYLAANRIEADWSAHGGFSEFSVPNYFRGNPAKHDFALIDGNHAIPSVFADFIHLSAGLKKHGLLFVDDLQLPGPYGLSRFMESFPHRWKLQDRLNKLACYEKIADFGIDGNNHTDVKIFS